MIAFALIAGLICLGVAAADALRRPGDPYGAIRIPVAGVWAATWLCYGLNLTSFPAPGSWTLFVISVACIGALLTCPLRTDDATPVTASLVPWLRLVLIAMAVALAVWDLYFIVDRVSTHGLTAGLSHHRLERGAKGGAYGIPGIEVLHAAVAAAGALGWAHWLLTRQPLSLLAAACGLATALFSTGRWDVVAYVVWLFAIYTFVIRGRGFGRLAMQAAVFLAVGVFFVAHGRLLGKLDGATVLANASSEDRAEAARLSLPTLDTAGPGNASARPLVPAGPRATCPGWVRGAEIANRSFRSMSSVTRMLLLYFSGPLATLDRALCEDRPAERVVLMYWPNKVARVAGLRPPETLLVVDPFLDIGIPFNNYTVIYQFLSEVGDKAGLVAWLIVGAAIGLASTWFLRLGTVSGVVAGTAPMAMAIRTPWTNTFFDGTLAIWIAVAVTPMLVAWAVSARARRFA